MTDFLKMKGMLESSKIEFCVGTDTEERLVRMEKRAATKESGERVEIDWPITENFVSGKTLRVDGGYCGFYTIIKFDVEGKLLSMEAFE